MLALMMNQRGNIGRRVRIARQSKGLSVRVLAARIERSYHTIYRWEQGKRDPGVDDLRVLAIVLERPVLWFIEGDADAELERGAA